MTIKVKVLIICILCSFTLFSKTAKAVGLGDSALTVAVTTVSGAILGASTLPFYEDSGAHTKNIFYGAAVGAVGGVLIAAFAGVQEGRVQSDEDIAFHKKDKKIELPQKSSALKESRYTDQGFMAWTPVLRYQF